MTGWGEANSLELSSFCEFYPFSIVCGGVGSLFDAVFINSKPLRTRQNSHMPKFRKRRFPQEVDASRSSKLPPSVNVGWDLRGIDQGGCMVAPPWLIKGEWA